jgi:hypothetical protein
MMRRLTLATLVLVCAGACGKSAEQKQAEDAAKGAQQAAQGMQQAAQQMANGGLAQGMQQMAQGFQQMAQGAQGANAKAVDFEVLKGLLPDVGGWARSGEQGQQLSMPVAYSHAEAQYLKDNARVHLEINDTALSQVLLAPMSIFLASGYSERSDDGFKRAAKVGGQPGMEDWEAKSKHAEVTALVGNRFVVSGKGDDVDSVDTVRKVVESVDFGKLAALK